MKISHITTNYLKKIALCFLLLVFLTGCSAEKEVVFEGTTMGTTYQIKIIAGYFKRTSGLKEKIDSRLHVINQSMSTYLPDSEISRFNAIQDTREKLAVSDDFLQVILAAGDIYEKTGGAWDGTIKPLVNLWGFGNTRQTHQVPDEAEIKKQMRWIGFEHIDISSEGYLQKKKSRVTLDLASIAKGYAVEQVSQKAIAGGFTSGLISVGGNVRRL